jgi:ectoine hydroxylase-related dioxygenase (phytanoyl-CoA dioxygenase family)
MANVIKTKLIEGEGYVVLENIIPLELIDAITNKLDTLQPVRASSSNKKYAEKDDIKSLSDISVWWSQMVKHWPEVKEINNILLPKVRQHLTSAEFYASDIVTIEKHSKWYNPHVDTPHRFKKYNYDRRLLGIQAIIPLFDLDNMNGATGLVPNSQIKDFNINLCYQGFYDTWFMKNCIQPKLPKGSVLFYNCRLLHSSMPNPTNDSRPALLLNYLERSIIEDVMLVDNIWASNGNQ